jgi:hypothetical protein
MTGRGLTAAERHFGLTLNFHQVHKAGRGLTAAERRFGLTLFRQMSQIRLSTFLYVFAKRHAGGLLTAPTFDQASGKGSHVC